RRHHLSTSAYLSFLLSCHAPHRALHSFPTRRSSDLPSTIKKKPSLSFFKTLIAASVISERLGCFVSSLSNSGAIGPSANNPSNLDRKSTRLNSSHVSISYAVFCLKKKNKKTTSHVT